jgi:TonB family protein
MSEKIVVLTVKSQKTSGEKIFRLHKRRAVIGSADSSDLRLDDASVSPVHAILEVSGVDGKPVIYDLASETGVQVNGKPTVQQTLEGSDRLMIGPYVIGVRVQELGEVPRAPEMVKESFGQTLFVNEQEDLKPLLLEDEREVLDIFDYRPESKTSLQVVMFFNDTILDIEHFVDKKRIVIGPGTHEDFSIPPFLGKGKTGRFDLVTREGDKWLLHLHDAMEGVVSKQGRLVPVKEIMAMSSDASRIYQLEDKDFAKVKLNDVSFFMNFTPAPPRLKARRVFERDPAFFKIWSASLVSTCALLLTISSMTVNPQIEIEQLPERVATILYEPKLLPVEKPPQPKPTPVVAKEPELKPKPVKTPPPKKIVVEPKPVHTPAPKNPVIAEKPAPQQQKPKHVVEAPKKLPTIAKRETKPHPASGHEGEGAKAKGTEGMRGKPNAPKNPIPQNKAMRPGEGKKTNAAAMNRGHSQTDDMGVVDVFKSNKGTLSKLLAGGRGASNAAAKLEGYSGFTTEGKGGLGEAGSGSGGGGKSEGLGGLSDKGAGGGKRGTGLGALGQGGNMLGGTGKLAIASGGAPEPIVLGAIDTDAIAREIAKHRDEIKYCYEKEINAEHPDLAGRVGIRFVIGASGSVTTAGVSTTSLRNANTERCVVEVIRRIVFPPVRGGGIAEVTYPFVFKPSNK